MLFSLVITHGMMMMISNSEMITDSENTLLIALVKLLEAANYAYNNNDVYVLYEAIKEANNVRNEWLMKLLKQEGTCVQVLS